MPERSKDDLTPDERFIAGVFNDEYGWYVEEYFKNPRAGREIFGLVMQGALERIREKHGRLDFYEVETALRKTALPIYIMAIPIEKHPEYPQVAARNNELYGNIDLGYYAVLGTGKPEIIFETLKRNGIASLEENLENLRACGAPYALPGTSLAQKLNARFN